MTTRGPVALSVVLLAAGCGGPSRAHVSGAVTWKGRPVLAGEVIFEPDPARGNAGPQVIAAIKDGRYATPPGRGSVTGPVTVTVRGFDGVPSDHPLGRPLFPDYTSPRELAAGSSGLDLAVPDDLKFE